MSAVLVYLPVFSYRLFIINYSLSEFSNEYSIFF